MHNLTEKRSQFVNEDNGKETAMIKASNLYVDKSKCRIENSMLYGTFLFWISIRI